jgi:hypothetical protein
MVRDIDLRGCACDGFRYLPRAVVHLHQSLGFVDHFGRMAIFGKQTSGLGQSRRFCDVCFTVRYPRYQTFSHPIETGLLVAFAPIVNHPRNKGGSGDDGIDRLGGTSIAKEPAYRLHETGTQSALVMHFLILPDRNLSKNFAGLARRETSTA